jgi:hypothetical protein
LVRIAARSSLSPIVSPWSILSDGIMPRAPLLRRAVLIFAAAVQPAGHACDRRLAPRSRGPSNA